MMIKKILKPSCYLSALLMSLAATGVQAAYYDFTIQPTLVDIHGGGATGTIARITNYGTDAIVGTGVFDSFIRTQVEFGHRGNCVESPLDCEQGYNTDGIEEYDTKESGGHNWNHSVAYSDMVEVTIDGDPKKNGGYFEFLLDVNEPNGDKSLISLDELQFFVTTDPALTGYDDTNNLFNLPDTELVWELDRYVGGVERLDLAGGIPDPDPNCDPATSPCTITGNPNGAGAENNAVELDYDLQAGSGNGIDLIVRIAKADFEEQFGQNGNGITKQNAYVVLFNRFGDVQNALSQAGFEEWAYRSKSNGDGDFPSGGPGVPEPSALALMGIGMLGMLGFSRKRRRS